MDCEFVQFEKDENVGILTINRPKALNALNIQLMDELDATLDNIAADAEIYALIITGVGKGFMAGADIATMKPMDYEQGKAYGIKGCALFQKIEDLDIPVIAAVNGFALGGGNELMLSCDVAIASEKAKFGQPEVGLGITPGFAGTQRLPRIVGPRVAKELIYSGRVFGAAEAEKIGLINKVVPPEELMETAKSMARSFAKMAPFAVKYAKKAINEGLQTDIDHAVKIENDYFGKCFSTNDQEEGMGAFLEKRKATFTNK
ncbi:3-hydroxypropionyl-coenzyme A dehydratase [Candidatus Lokiarchaeum ossiferum]|uniref:3-hydroxypropionyl-coenzyme A dehydratase n=1 Tax=Candidatus Lokiarchaeum ossiferum TaxID=2951803 RepID=A0ABY6HT37_9ARCH|nr:3-hydroxypropionyl-coenzyme A dehydratase [Candidatus Lokiarchaeum sp. B-35]